MDTVRYATLEFLGDLYDFVCFEYVARLDVVEAFQLDAAFQPGPHLASSLTCRNDKWRVVGHDPPIPNDAQVVAMHDAAGHAAACHQPTRNVEDLRTSPLRHLLPLNRLEQAASALVNVVQHLVYHTVQPDCTPNFRELAGPFSATT